MEIVRRFRGIKKGHPCGTAFIYIVGDAYYKLFTCFASFDLRFDALFL